MIVILMPNKRHILQPFNKNDFGIDLGKKISTQLFTIQLFFGQNEASADQQ